MSTTNTETFDPDCRDCPRLANFLDQTGQAHPDYHARPVAPFGDPDARLLIVGLAPGMHGANATGRPFTGDYAGILLYQTLFDFDFSNKPVSVSQGDGLELFLRHELETLPDPAVVIGLGKIAHDAVLRAFKLRLSAFTFGHGNIHELDNGLTMIDSYHCSRYNTQTRRLTPAMFSEIFVTARQLLDSSE